MDNKSTLLVALALSVAAAVSAQLPSTGFYRVSNVSSSRYMMLNDKVGSINYSSSSADMGALHTAPDYDRVVSDPSSVFYVSQEEVLSSSIAKYNFCGQGTSMFDIIQHVLQVQYVGGVLRAYASSAGVTMYLHDTDGYMSKEKYFGYEYGILAIGKSPGSDKTYQWKANPVKAGTDSYFGLRPTVTAGGKYYQPFYAGFPFSFYSQGMKAYYVTKVDKARGMVVYKELTGVIPASTPMFIECASQEPAGNQLDLLWNTGTAPTDNQLTGVYFCNFKEKAQGTQHIDCVAYDASTMRVLGRMADGSLGYVKATADMLTFDLYIPGNTAYLKVDADAPAELKLVTEEEYNKVPDITVTARSYTRAYGDANPTFEYDANGSFSGQPQLTCAATATSPVGTYPITVAQGTVTGANVIGVAGTLTITKAPVTVTARSYTIQETEALPTFAVDYAGWKNGETASVLTKQPTITCNVPAAKTPGEYPITADGAEAQNYSFTYVPGKLTITQAPTITIKAAAKSMVYGDQVPELTYTVEGGTLTGTPKLTTTATSASDVGEYAITVEAGTISYPRLSLQGAKLTISQAPVVVTAKSYTIQETAALPTYAADYAGFKNGQSESVLTKQPTFACDVPAAKTPGEYTITVSGAEAKNYAFSYVNGKLTITQVPTITIKAAAKTMVYGDQVPELTYTVEGGTLTGTPKLTTTATSTSDAGEYDIVVEAGDIAYPRLSLQGAKLTVTQAALTASAGTYTMKQTEQRPTFKATYSGWKNNDDESALTKQPAFSCNAPADNTPGEYEVTLSGAEAKNYQISYEAGKLIITEADAITIVVANATMVYGDEVPAFTYTVNGGTLEGEPVISCEATSKSDVGEYVITVEKGNISYPRLTLVNGKLTITPAALTVTAQNADREYGEENPELTLSYDGFKNDDTAAALTAQPVAATTATKESGVGEYVIGLEGGEAKNYTITLNNGKLTITPATLTVTAQDASRLEGEENPVFELTYSGWKNNDDESVLTQKPTATTTATASSTAGEYEITVSGGEAQNYTFVYVSGTLTVEEANGIAEVIGQGKAFDVYTTSGLKVRANVTTLNGLPKGIYVVNGRKVMVK